MSEEHEWHGWARSERIGARSLHIGPLPGRRSIALYEQQGGRLRVYAYFRSEFAAEDARALLDYLTGYPCGFKSFRDADHAGDGTGGREE